jgi:hypothetical protein
MIFFSRIEVIRMFLTKNNVWFNRAALAKYIKKGKLKNSQKKIVQPEGHH